MTPNHAAQPGQHRHAERQNDLYETPACATLALMRAENLPHHIWEPAAGRGAIVDVLRDAGHFVFASDLVDYGIDGQLGNRDFLLEHKLPAGIELILTNPPFKIANQFVEHALELCPRVIMLARLAFLESERRTRVLEDRGLARVHIFRARLPMMHRDGWQGPKASSATAFAWFCWDREHRGQATINRISGKEST
jgi:hypothetical protein